MSSDDFHTIDQHLQKIDGLIRGVDHLEQLLASRPHTDPIVGHYIDNLVELAERAEHSLEQLKQRVW